LENIPGLNGDEAWYGVQAWWMLHGGAAGGWQTPTGNPINPLFLGPLALLHLWFSPSICLLRSVALVGGLAALVINWLLCRWVFDRRTAAISTLLLAVLPINIAYSRFAWDASQSLAVTLPVVYLALAAVRFPERFGRWIAAALLAQAIALWVHPTNVFAGAVVAVACIAHWYRKNDEESRSSKSKARRFGFRISDFGFPSSFVLRPSSFPFVLLALACLVFAVWLWAAWPLGRIGQRAGDLRGLAQVADLYPRLFTGGTIYRYVAGSRSWFEWPLPAHLDGWGLDVGLFWGCVLASAWLLWYSSRLRLRNDRDQRSPRCDRVLLAAWALTVAAFVLVAGPQAMIPGQERFAICLVAPTVVLLARGAALAWEAASPRWRVALAAATLAGWPLVADFHAHYFRFIERSGGQSHFAFRTAALEPKQAALQSILAETGGRGTVPIFASTKTGLSPLAQETWIVCRQWWNRWPIRYLALSDRAVRVPDPGEIISSDDYRRALAEGRVWFVEFCGTEELQQAESQLAQRRPARWLFLDYGRRPLLCVLHAAAE